VCIHTVYILDEDNNLLGCVKDKEDMEKCLRHKLLLLNTWWLIPSFKLFMSSPKDILHQWLVACSCMYMTVLGTYCYILCLYLLCTGMYQVHTLHILHEHVVDCDYIRLCGMGVSAVQRCDVCKMLHLD
jgi:hypothetical protein